MRSIGLAIKKNELWLAVLDGSSRQDASIFALKKELFNADSNIQELMLHFFNLFTEIITKYKPDSVAYKAHLDSKLNQIHYMQFPLGLLNYICKINNIQTTLRSGSWISAGKKTKQIECTNFFNDHDLKAEKLAAVLVAWHQFT